MISHEGTALDFTISNFIIMLKQYHLIESPKSFAAFFGGVCSKFECFSWNSA